MGNRLKPAPPVDLRVASPDNTGNITINQLLGNRNDNHEAGTVYSNIDDLWEGSHHEQRIYPDLAAAVTVSTHSDDWTLGNFAEIVPVNTIPFDFHIHHIHVTAADANADYIIVVYNGTTEIARLSFSRTDKKDDIEGLDVIMPHCLANSQVQAKLANSRNGNVDSVKIRIWYYVHC